MEDFDRASLASLQNLLRAAQEVARDASLVEPLAASTGLSVEGVAFALERSLEADASDADLLAILRASGRAARVHVILSANVFTAPLRALVVARAASSRVTVRASRRDPVFTRALLAASRDDAFELVSDLAVASLQEGEVHVYGRDSTVAAVRAAASHGVRVRGHGAGLGVALVDGGGDVEADARALADDVVAFDQRGCLSPRIAFVTGGVARARDFAAALSRRLGALALQVPRGRLDDDETRDAARYRETLAFAGELLVGADHAVGVLDADVPLVVPPPGRHVHLVGVDDARDAAHALAPIERLVVAVGSSTTLADAPFLDAPGRVRRSPLGRMQRPPLDGPVDLRELGVLPVSPCPVSS